MTTTLLHEWLAVADAGEFDAFRNYLHEDVVVHAPLGLSTQGIDAEINVWKAALAAMPDLRHEIQEVVASSSTVAARVVVTGTHRGDFAGIPATGRPFRIDQAVFAHIRNEKATEVWEIVDTAALLEQLGALPAPSE